MFFDLSNFKASRQDFNRKLVLPNRMTEDLAELIGINYGDGNLYHNINNHNYVISYSGSVWQDAEYMDHLSNLFYLLFHLYLYKVLVLSKNCLILKIHSKTIYLYMVQYLEIPSGPKKDLRIPNVVKLNKDFLSAFIRGLFDTDGCFVIQKNEKYIYPLVKISMKSQLFAKDVHNALKNLGLKSYICKKKINFEGYDVVLRNKEVSKFFEIIKPHNKRKVNYFENFSKNIYGD